MFLKYRFKPLVEYKNNWLLGFVLVLAATFFLRFNNFEAFQNFVAGLYLLRLIFYLLAMPYLVFHLKKGKDGSFKKGIVIFLAVTALVSVARIIR